MKSPEDWKKLLGSINFPNFNKSDNEEVMEFIFSNCKQRDALLTWMVIQLGADFDSRILKHEVVAEYLKKRKIAENDKIVKFVEASLPKFDQEAMWDKIFSYIKMQKRLIPQPYEGMPQKDTFDLETDTIEYNEKFQDLSAKENLEPLYKELDLLKTLKKTKPSVVEAAQNIGDRRFEHTDENLEDTEGEKNEETIVDEKDNDDDTKNNKKPEKKGGKVEEGGSASANKALPTEKTVSGTWYNTPDGRQKVFVPVGAPPLGEFKFDSKTMKIVHEEDKPCTEKELKFAERMEALEKRFSRFMNKSNDES